MKRRIALATAAALLASTAAAIAANNTFFTSIGDLVFPFSPPTASGTPGTIDNMTIGATTPAAVHATTLSATSAPTGTGITALFASPPAIGGTTPAAGAFTTLSSISAGSINGDPATSCATYFFTGTPAATTQVFFLATRPMIVKEVSEVHSVAAGGTSTLGVYHDTGTEAPGGGTDVLTADFDLNGTANTVQTGAISSTGATIDLAAGDRLSVKFADAIQSSAGVVVTACMAPN